ncbi:MAG: M20 family metallopeptidase [Phycisphaerae bacterium]
MKALDPHQLAAGVEARLPDAQHLLAELISTPSLSGKEQAAMEVAEKAFAKVAQVQRVPMTNALREDKDYSDPVPGIEYNGRWNLRAAFSGGRNVRRGGPEARPSDRKQGKSLLLNTHIDTVPPAQGQVDPFVPAVGDGVMFGRGACDAKGQAATIWLAMAALKDLGVQLAGDLIAHLVVEEENGGNGTLAMVRAGEKADGCIVLEPTDMKVLHASRGAVWFHIDLYGKAGHSGQAGVTRSALKMAIRVMEILEGYHARLLASSRGGPCAMFDKFPNPMPLTIGQLHAGNWPSTAPPEAFLEGVLGLLPSKTARQVMDEMTAVIRAEGGPEIADNFKIHFTYRHDSSICPADHSLVTALSAAVASAGRSAVVDAMTASCDAWFYNNQLGIPAVIFGGGSLSVAHSAREQMPLADLAAAAAAIACIAADWCGG